MKQKQEKNLGKKDRKTSPKEPSPQSQNLIQRPFSSASRGKHFSISMKFSS